jgi:succinate dehydrogenase / fumarate reductase flavoprotein subunit
MAELGYGVSCFCFQDSPRRAHSIAAQGGINAAKDYQNDGDTIFRLFYDTIKGGDYRGREANTYRLAEVSNNIIDQCVAQGIPFAREYGGYLANRSFGGAQVSRTFYARGHGRAPYEDRDARPGGHRRPGPRDRDPQHGDR